MPAYIILNYCLMMIIYFECYLIQKAVGCEDGTIAYYQLIFSTVHGLYKDRLVTF